MENRKAVEYDDVDQNVQHVDCIQFQRPRVDLCSQACWGVYNSRSKSYHGPALGLITIALDQSVKESH